MHIIDVGSGPPLVLVPGIQGRWEWMKPAVDALAAHCRVITFSLADEPTCAGRFDARRGFDSYVQQVADAMDIAGVSTATVCGVSYGGLIAAAFAARHPQRTTALVLVSALPPSWTPDSRARFYLHAPRLLSPLFVIGSLRLFKEIAAASSGVLPGMAAAARHGARVIGHMFSPSRMARRIRLAGTVELERELLTVHLPTLVVTGDSALERVVPVRLTEEYLRLWPHATRATISRTGHLGLITRPDVFAETVGPFVDLHGRWVDAAEKRVG